MKFNKPAKALWQVGQLTCFLIYKKPFHRKSYLYPFLYEIALMTTSPNRQSTNHLLMIRPSHFGYNQETAKSNAFQVNPETTEDGTAEIRQKAKEEFDGFVELLQRNGVKVTVIKEQNDPITPDAVFPNNWVSFHQNGTAITYPMESESRRFERDEKIIDLLAELYDIHAVFNLDTYEDKGLFLEGTGSMVLDRKNSIVYSCLSPRTNIEVLEAFCKLTKYRKVVFNAVDGGRQPIYHTNVMMTIADKFVVICLDTVLDKKEKDTLLKYFFDSNKEVIKITLDQMNAFAGNMLQVHNDRNVPFLVMSTQAYNILRPDQIRHIERHLQILHHPIPTIEQYGGGSVRCMMAEVFLPAKQSQ